MEGRLDGYAFAASPLLKENAPTSETLPSGTKQGVKDFKCVGYGGPCPPPGKTASL